MDAVFVAWLHFPSVVWYTRKSMNFEAQNGLGLNLCSATHNFIILGKLINIFKAMLFLY